MITIPESVVIVKHPGGFVAHVRFENKKHDIDISSKSKYYLYQLIEGHTRRVNE